MPMLCLVGQSIRMASNPFVLLGFLGGAIQNTAFDKDV
jgi:hypothetical protein